MQQVLDDVAQFMGKYVQELVVLEVMVYPGVQGGDLCTLAKLFGVLGRGVHTAVCNRHPCDCNSTTSTLVWIRCYIHMCCGCAVCFLCMWLCVLRRTCIVCSGNSRSPAEPRSNFSEQNVIYLRAGKSEKMKKWNLCLYI